MNKKGMRQSHPGSILAGMIEGMREESGKSYPISEIASALGITTTALSSVLNQHSGIDEQLAAKLSATFETSTDLWLNLQRNYDAWMAENQPQITH